VITSSFIRVQCIVSQLGSVQPHFSLLSSDHLLAGFRAYDSCLMLDYVGVINFLLFLLLLFLLFLLLLLLLLLLIIFFTKSIAFNHF